MLRCRAERRSARLAQRAFLVPGEPEEDRSSQPSQLLPSADGDCENGAVRLTAHAESNVPKSVARGRLRARPPCDSCDGSGRSVCITCSGAGRLNRPSTPVLPRGGARALTLPASKRQMIRRLPCVVAAEYPHWCLACRGSGRVVCGRCDGSSCLRDADPQSASQARVVSIPDASATARRDGASASTCHDGSAEAMGGRCVPLKAHQGAHAIVRSLRKRWDRWEKEALSRSAAAERAAERRRRSRGAGGGA